MKLITGLRVVQMEAIWNRKALKQCEEASSTQRQAEGLVHRPMLQRDLNGPCSGCTSVLLTLPRFHCLLPRFVWYTVRGRFPCTVHTYTRRQHRPAGFSAALLFTHFCTTVLRSVGRGSITSALPGTRGPTATGLSNARNIWPQGILWGFIY